MRAIFGADRADRRAPSACAARRSASASRRDAVRAGICLLTEDRKSPGPHPGHDLRPEHDDHPSRRGRAARGLLQTRPGGRGDRGAHRRPGHQGASRPSQVVRFLSGGNQQKVVVAKWLFADAQVLIFDEPTRGIDVGAKFEIYNLIWDLAERGKGIIVVSSDLPELLGICHRIVVFSKGAIVGELPREGVQREGRPGARLPQLPGPRGDRRAGRAERHGDAVMSAPSSQPRPAAGPRRRAAARQPGRRLRAARGRRGRGARRAHPRLQRSSRPTSRRPTTSSAILGQISINTILAVGMTFVILIGGIDLSVGSVLALTTVVGRPGAHRHDRLRRLRLTRSWPSR